MSLREIRKVRKCCVGEDTIHYADEGQGEVLVFVHGLFLSGGIWQKVVDALSTRYRCIVPEFPFGAHPEPFSAKTDLSPIGAAKLLASFLDELDVHNATLVGVDFGAVVAKITTARFGSRVQSLVITNCDALEVFPAKGFGYLRWLPAIPGGMLVMSQFMYRSKWLRHHHTSFGAFTKHPVSDELLLQFIEPLARSSGNRRDAGKLMSGIDPRLTLSLPAELRASKKNILVLWGEEDALFDADLATRLSRAIGKHSELTFVPNAKTFIALDAPQATADSIDAFMQR